mgnify:CR=1 FL=1
MHGWGAGNEGTGAVRVDKVLTTPSGFIGIDGAFRLLQNGINQRALAVYQIERGSAGVIDPAPKNFSRAGGL